ncbi:YbaK/EbsC family protein [Pseudoalteromonas sp. C2R02]|uniref:YbaK/EbsC family protein n=1 Tax=Pseudoalteromonas sp. C2R02 TaxID=2841565 RepID=UPI001C08A60D|nr:YbaK/EbsC family protein [Pseudoalteromonas sp. C2R02]MBU2968564.1 YbaK/EbsC family protein [Pseudoalteromonas sp. C2R02]
MAISRKLEDYFSKQNISFQRVSHFYSNNSIGSAVASSIPPKNIAKAVLLVDHDGHRLMAVLPADQKINIVSINEELHASFELLKERDVFNLFMDCAKGAIPPVGEAFNMSMVYDESLDMLDNVFIEAGDHETLLKLTHQDFENIMGNSKHLKISKNMLH